VFVRLLLLIYFIFYVFNKTKQNERINNIMPNFIHAKFAGDLDYSGHQACFFFISQNTAQYVK